MDGHSILQFKVTLKHVSPPIWRNIEIYAGDSFEILHLAIQSSFGWENYHMYGFKIGEMTIAGGEISIEDGFGDELSYEVVLSQLFKKAGQKGTYNYDFGDNWEHEIVLEGIDTAKDIFYPRCTKGARTCPPEDCGGPFGYMHLLETISNPKSDGYADMRDWLGLDDDEIWDAEYFDLNETNEYMESYFQEI